MPTCSFCRKNFKEPRGLTVFTFDGKAINYCSSKCRRNAALGRDGRKINWVKKSGVSFGVAKEEIEVKKAEKSEEEKK